MIAPVVQNCHLYFMNNMENVHLVSRYVDHLKNRAEVHKAHPLKFGNF